MVHCTSVQQRPLGQYMAIPIRVYSTRLIQATPNGATTPKYHSTDVMRIRLRTMPPYHSAFRLLGHFLNKKGTARESTLVGRQGGINHSRSSRMKSPKSSQRRPAYQRRCGPRCGRRAPAAAAPSPARNALAPSYTVFVRPCNGVDSCRS